MHCGITAIIDRKGAKQKHERFVLMDKTMLAPLAASHMTLYLLCMLKNS